MIDGVIGAQVLCSLEVAETDWHIGALEREESAVDSGFSLEAFFIDVSPGLDDHGVAIDGQRGPEDIYWQPLVEVPDSVANATTAEKMI
jgi:hypothetical protein